MSSAVLTVCAGLLIWFSEDCLLAAAGAAGVFASGVMPALFPMMVLAGIPFAPSASREKQGAWRKGVRAMLFGFAAGSPAGARCVEGMRGAGQLGEDQAARLFVAVGVMSPMFFLGTLAFWTRNAQAALVMLAAHWLSALGVGGLFALLSRLGYSPGRAKKARTSQAFQGASPDGLPHARIPSSTDGKTPSFFAALPEAIAGAGQTLLSVCGTMMLFSIVQAILRALLVRLFPAWTEANGELLAILYALLEVGGGTNAVVKSFLVQGEHLFALLCGLCSFGGFSIWMQNLIFTRQSIRPGTLLLCRMIHGALAYGICRFMLLLWPQTVQAWSVMEPARVTVLGNPLLILGALLALEALGAFWRRSKTC